MMNTSPNDIQKRIEFLGSFMTPERFEKILHHVQFRMRHLTVVIEDVYQPHNASAVLRSCDCFGIQDVHIIENQNTYEVNPDVALGSAQWLTLKKFSGENSNTLKCYEELRSKGYRIIATTPHTDDVLLEELDVTSPFALVFGTEKEGLTCEAIEKADQCVKIPMFGFTESLNISVSAAICLHFLTMKIRRDVKNWPLTGEDQKKIILEWLRCSLKDAKALECEFEKQIKG